MSQSAHRPSHPSHPHPTTPRPAAQRARMRENFLFLGKFFRHGIKIASIWPSSPALSKATVKEIDWDNAQVIVELGAGTGPITEQIIRRLRPHTKFIAIERDADFAKILKRRFSDHDNVEIVQSDVRELDALLRARGIKKVDAFVSGLPTPTLPKSVQARMLASVRRYLVDGGVFSNITEIPFYYWKYYKKFFNDVSFDFVVKNMPPGGVYHCRACK